MSTEEIFSENQLKNSINNVVTACYASAKAGGWWNNPDGTPRNLDPTTFEGMKAIAWPLLLQISEICEAAEAVRKGNLADDKLPHRSGLEVELADAVIRICDLAGGLNLDLAGAIIEKLAYNQQREDHKPENRKKANGKVF
jgi:NTP pyrophosphatase (non-canonical NTP hydrolase)